MNFTFVFENDPYRDLQQGNITWLIPNIDIPGHWIHAEDICNLIEGSYMVMYTYSNLFQMRVSTILMSLILTTNHGD